MREWTRDVRGMLQRARESGNRERRRVSSFHFFMIHHIWKTFRRERERERKRVVLIHHQRVSPLLLFLFDCRFKKRSFSRAHICSLLLLLLRSLRELSYRRA